MKKLSILVALFVFIFLTASCQKSQEVTVSKYFQAMKHNDKDTMAAMSLDPKFIEFKSYKIESVSEPVIEEYKLPILMQKMEEFKNQRKDLARLASDKRDEMEGLKDELTETRGGSRRSELQRQIKDAEVAFYKVEQDFKGVVVRMGDLKNEIEKESNMVGLSTGIKRNAETYLGKTEKSIVKVKVTLPDNSQNDYFFQVIKYSFTLNEKTIPSRLLILKIQAAQEFEKESQMAAEEAAQPAEEVSEPAPVEEKNE